MNEDDIGKYVTVIYINNVNKGRATVQPNATSYSISKIDPYVYFNKLPAGTYYYRITAVNSAGSLTDFTLPMQFTIMNLYQYTL